MDYWLIAYVLLCIVLGTSTVSFFFQKGQSIAAMLLLVLIILVFVFYGLRWFDGGNLKGGDKAKVWPPIVNMCPDFMVSWTDSVTRNVYCYDANNIYKLKTGAAAGTVGNLTINNMPNQSAYLIKNAAQNPGATDLRSDPNGARWPLLYTMRTRPQVITGDPNGGLLRWEGVWDGRQASPTKAPLP
jgi:uncharacterized protein (UPF0333 family)